MLERSTAPLDREHLGRIGTDNDFSAVRRLVDDVLARQDKPASTEPTHPFAAANVAAALSDFQEVLLAETLRHAAERTLFYPAWFRRSGFDPLGYRSSDDLRHVPILTRRSISDAEIGQLHATGHEIVGFRQTSGTTGSRRLVVTYTDEEVRFSRSLDNAGRVKQPHDAEKRLAGSVRYVVRRYQSQWPFRQDDSIVVNVPFQFDAPGNAADYYDYVLAMVFEQFEIPGVEPHFSSLGFSPAFILQSVTDQAARRGIDLRRGSVRSITCTGSPLSSTALRRIEAAWDAAVLPIYSCAELNAAAPGCRKHPGVYHFPPSQRVEVLRPETLEAVAAGEDGLLVVTSLYPFQIGTPFVRYWTGDLAQQCGQCCDCGHIGASLRLIGRNSNAVDLLPALGAGSGRRFLGAIDLIEALDALGTVPRKEMYRFRLETEEEGGHLTVIVGIEGLPEQVADPDHPVRGKLVRRLLAVDPQWQQAAAAGRLRIVVEVAMLGFLDNSMVLKLT